MCERVTIEKQLKGVVLGTQAAVVEGRARGMAQDLTRWLQEYAGWAQRLVLANIPITVAQVEAEEEQVGVPFQAAETLPEEGTLEPISKADSEQELRADLRRILNNWGLRQLEEGAGRGVAMTVGPFSVPKQTLDAIDRGHSVTRVMETLPGSVSGEQRIAFRRMYEQNFGQSAKVILQLTKQELARKVPRVVIRQNAVDDFLATKEVQLQQIIESSRGAVTGSVRDIIRDALLETPKPSPSDIARRIKSRWHGDADEAGTRIDREGDPLIGPDGRPLERTEVGPIVVIPGVGVRRLSTKLTSTKSGLAYAFSAERAALIARTELAQAENSGINEGYLSTGVKMLEWLSYNDGRSGRRKHNEMGGQKRKLTARRMRKNRFYNKATGNFLWYPGDPEADIEDTANCRCTTAAVRG